MPKTLKLHYHFSNQLATPQQIGMVAPQISTLWNQGRGYGTRADRGEYSDQAWRDAGFSGGNWLYLLLHQIMRKPSSVYGFTPNQLTPDQATFNLLPEEAFLHTSNAIDPTTGKLYTSNRINYTVTYDGNPVEFVHTDPGSQALRDWMVDRVEGYLAQYPLVHGIGWDNISASLRKVKSREGMSGIKVYSGTGEEYNDFTFAQAVIGLLQYLKDNVTPPAGRVYLQGGNLIEQIWNSSSSPTTLYTSYSSCLDWILDESDTGWPMYGGNYSASEINHHINQNIAWLAANPNKMLSLDFQSSSAYENDTVGMREAVAIGLLVTPTTNTVVLNGVTMTRLTIRFTNASRYRFMWFYPDYEVDLGAPLGAAVQAGNVWYRLYERGRVDYNSSTRVGSVTVGSTPPPTTGFVVRKVAVTKQLGDGTTNTSIPAALRPDDSIENDTLLIKVQAGNANAVFTVPGTWTYIGRGQSNSSIASAIYLRRVAAGEPASYAVSINMPVFLHVEIGGYGGVKNNPTVQHIARFVSNGNADGATGTVTTLEDAILVALHSMNWGYTNIQSAPNNWTPRNLDRASTSPQTSSRYDIRDSSPGPKGPFPFTIEDPATTIIHLIALPLDVAAPPAAQAEPKLRGVGPIAICDAGTTFSTSGTPGIQYPNVDIQAGDAVLLHIYHRNTGSVEFVSVTTGPTGFTPRLDTPDGFDSTMRTYTRIAAGTEDNTYVTSTVLGTAVDAVAFISVWYDVDPTDPFFGFSGSVQPSQTATTMASIAAAPKNSKILMVTGIQSASYAHLPPGTMAEHLDGPSNAAISASISLSSETWTPAGGASTGDTGTRTGTVAPGGTPTASKSIVHGIVLKPKPGVVAPTAPSGLTGTPSVDIDGLPRATLNWTDNSTSETSLTVWRAPGSTSAFVAIATLPANTTLFPDPKVGFGEEYRYYVQANNSAGSSSSAVVSVILPNIVSITATNVSSGIRLILDLGQVKKGEIVIEVFTAALGWMVWDSFDASLVNGPIIYADALPATEYQIRAAIVTASGQSPYVLSNTITTPIVDDEDPPPPIVEPEKPAISRIELIVRGQPLDITDLFRYAANADGLGMAPVEWFLDQGPNQDGATADDFRMRPRTIALALTALVEQRADVDARRDEMVRYLRPRRQRRAVVPTTDMILNWQRDDLIHLRITRTDGSVRQLDTIYQDGMGLGVKDALGAWQRAAILLQTHGDPSFYDPDVQMYRFAISQVNRGFSIPLRIPWAVGSSRIHQVMTIPYAGSWETSPVIIVTGPISNFSITNETTGEHIALVEGVSIPAGVTYYIDTRFGANTVIEAGSNIERIGQFTQEGDLSSFVLLGDSLGETTPNDIRVVGTGASDQTTIFLAFFTRYASS